MSGLVKNKDRKTFSEKGREEMHDFVKKAMDDLLEIMNSDIVFPEDKDGNVLEHKIFAVVQSREEVYNSVSEFIDMMKLNESKDQSYKNKIIKGLETTWRELTKITIRNIGSISLAEELLMGTKLSDEDRKKRERESVSDDRLSSISKAKVLSAKIAYKILDRIAILEDPEKAKKEIINKNQNSNICERYVQNR